LRLSLSQLAARRLRRDVSVEQDDEDYTERRSRLVRAATQDRSGGRRVPWRWLLLALGLAVPTTFYAVSTAQAKSFTAAGVSGEVGAFYEARAAELPLRFGDGSEIWLSAGSNARVLHSGMGRRALLLEVGALRAGLGGQLGWTWELSAGPFRLRSPEAALELRWDVATQRLTVTLHSGSVEVTGPGLDGGRTLTGSGLLTAGAAPSPPR
jgi:hypothetical protein